jgi:hypothetical protein
VEKNPAKMEKNLDMTPDQEMVTIIIQNSCGLMREVEFPNTTEDILLGIAGIGPQRQGEWSRC